MRQQINKSTKLILPTIFATLIYANPSNSQNTQHEITFKNSSSYHISDFKVVPTGANDINEESKSHVIYQGDEIKINLDTTNNRCLFNVRAVFRSGRASRIAESEGIDFCKSSIYEYR